MSTWRLLFIILAVVITVKIFVGDETTHTPGETVSTQPMQYNLDDDNAFEYKGYTITPLADFDITARVLSREDYRFDAGAELSPMDLALGWGPMSDSQVLEKITITQSNRWYHWRVDEFPIPRRDIETHSANMHMLPADDGVRNVLEQTRKGDIVELQGKLVRVTKPDGWRWQSSLTRDDTGNGSCEVIWVESFLIQ